MPKYRTRQDAFEVVTLAKTGCFTGANYDYLAALRRHVQAWVDEIDDELAVQRWAEPEEENDG